MKQNRRYLNAL